MGGVFAKEACEQFCSQVDENPCQGKENCPWYSDVEVDWNGCRKFSVLPPAGQHPRLYFTAEDIPRIIARFTHSEFGPQLQQILRISRDCFVRDFYTKFDALPEEVKDSPTSKETIDEWFTVNEGRSVHILGAYAFGIIYDDAEVAEMAKKFAVFYAKVVLRSREIALDEDIRQKPYHAWHSNEWNLEIGWLFGGNSYAFLYDIVYNDLSEEDRGFMRKAIASAVKGRRGWGMGWPTRRIQSNWASYHGDLLILNAAIEDEEGFDEEVFAMFSDLMVHYLDFAFYDSGHPIEDSYVLNVGFREGSLCFLVMARRGYNIFNHPHFKKIWTKWLPFALEPNNSGLLYGGSSGSNWTYPTSAIMTKYMFPRDPLVDHIYRHFMCENGKPWSRLTKVQSRMAALTFAIPALSMNLGEPEAPDRLDLPLDFVCRDRGKVIMRSDWSEDAMWFTLDARPDGFLIGHDVCSRGAFVLNANGRSWGFCPEWKWFDQSNDYSLPCIDDVGQKNKAPFVKLLNVSHGACGSTMASADITYAYNWKWTSWAKEGEDYTKRGWEVEPNDPRDFGYNVWWAPYKLFGEKNVAFVGLYQWRKRFASVEKVLRSTMLVRATRPYVIISDDVKKDNEEHKYTWAMTTPNDIELESFDGTDAILVESGGDGRRFLVRSLCGEKHNLECSFRNMETCNKSSLKQDHASQLMFTCTALQVKFKFLLFSLPKAESTALETVWVQKDSVLRVRDPETAQSQNICFCVGDNGETSMKVLETMVQI